MGKKEELEETLQMFRDSMKKVVKDSVLSNEEYKEKEREIERLKIKLKNLEND